MTRKQGFLRIPAVFAAFVFLCVLLVPTMAMASPSIIYGGTISGDYPFTAGKYFIDQGATVTFNGNVTIPADCTLDIDYGTVIINGNLLVNGTLDVDGGTLTVQNKNSTVVHGTLNLSVDVARQDLNYGGTLHATGAMTVEGANAQLIMINSNDLLTVDGKLTMDGADTVTNNSTEYNLSDGMLVLNGDFEQKATYASRSFYPERNPTGMQT